MRHAKVTPSEESGIRAPHFEILRFVRFECMSTDASLAKTASFSRASCAPPGRRPPGAAARPRLAGRPRQGAAPPPKRRAEVPRRSREDHWLPDGGRTDIVFLFRSVTNPLHVATCCSSAHILPQVVVTCCHEHMRTNYDKLLHFCDDHVCPVPVWKPSRGFFGKTWSLDSTRRETVFARSSPQDFSQRGCMMFCFDKSQTPYVSNITSN